MRRALRIPCDALITHPLQTDRLSNLLSDPGSLGGHIVGVVGAVCAGALVEDHAYLRAWNAEQIRRCIPNTVRFLTSEPDCRAAVLHFGNAATGCHRGVGLE